MNDHFEYLYSVLENYLLIFSQILSINILQGWEKRQLRGQSKQCPSSLFWVQGVLYPILALDSKILQRKGLFFTSKKDLVLECIIVLASYPSPLASKVV